MNVSDSRYGTSYPPINLRALASTHLSHVIVRFDWPQQRRLKTTKCVVGISFLYEIGFLRFNFKNLGPKKHPYEGCSGESRWSKPNNIKCLKLLPFGVLNLSELFKFDNEIEHKTSRGRPWVVCYRSFHQDSFAFVPKKVFSVRKWLLELNRSRKFCIPSALSIRLTKTNEKTSFNI